MRQPSASIGKHDFTSFRSAACQAESPVKTLDLITVIRKGDEICVTVKARSFLHHQVRNIVGTLKLVGEHKWPIERVEEALLGQEQSCRWANSACRWTLS